MQSYAKRSSIACEHLLHRSTRPDGSLIDRCDLTILSSVIFLLFYGVCALKK